MQMSHNRPGGTGSEAVYGSSTRVRLTSFTYTEDSPYATPHATKHVFCQNVMAPYFCNDEVLQSSGSCRNLHSAMSISASFAQIALMRSVALTGVVWSLYLNSRPSLDTIGDPFRVCFIKDWLARMIAMFATLVVNPRIILCARIHSDSDCDFLAQPSTGRTRAISAAKSSYDVGVVLSTTSFGIIFVIEIER